MITRKATPFLSQFAINANFRHYPAPRRARSKRLPYRQVTQRELHAGTERGHVHRNGVQRGRRGAGQRQGDGDRDGAVGNDAGFDVGNRVDVPGDGGQQLHAQRTPERWGELPGDYGDGKRGGERYVLAGEQRERVGWRFGDCERQ